MENAGGSKRSLESPPKKHFLMLRKKKLTCTFRRKKSFFSLSIVEYFNEIVILMKCYDIPASCGSAWMKVEQ